MLFYKKRPGHALLTIGMFVAGAAAGTIAGLCMRGAAQRGCETMTKLAEKVDCEKQRVTQAVKELGNRIGGCEAIKTDINNLSQRVDTLQTDIDTLRQQQNAQAAAPQQ